MLSEFRSRYPTGSLISELLTIYEGQYVVRTVIQVERVTLATGMAAERTLEQAEDRSRERALAVLGIAQPQTAVRHISEPPRETPATSAPAFSTVHLGQGKTRSRPPSPPLGSPTGFSPPGIHSPAPTQPPPPLEESSSTNDDWLYSAGGGASVEAEPTPSQGDRPTPDFPDRSPTTDDSPYPEFESSSQPPPPGAPEDRSAAPTPPPPRQTQAEHPPQESVNLSDIIAQTTVEIRRLGWSNDQGRNFLKEQYGKPSRSMLTEEELLEFLEFLKSQPTPSSDL